MINWRKKAVQTGLILAVTGMCLTGCGKDSDHGLSKEDPQEITVWNYYNGALAIQFNELVDKFNSTVGEEKGIIVNSESKSSVDELNQALLAAADKQVGAEEMPDIFQAYVQTAVQMDEKGLLADIGEYITEQEKSEYLEAYIDEGTFGTPEAWKLFPVAKSTEVLMLNKTDWEMFSAETGSSLENLTTWEGIADTAETYYEWSGGKAFFGRDAFANYMIVGSMQLGKELFLVNNGTVTLQFDEQVMKRLWDNFYIPYIKGYYSQVGRYRSDDIKLGEIIAQICSTSSAVYFPKEVYKADGSMYEIDYLVLPVPDFEGTDSYVVQQGASMAITKKDERSEYASVVFLKWFTQAEQNLEYCTNSGYLPVTKKANQISYFNTYCEENENAIEGVELDTIRTVLERLDSTTLYTSKGFTSGEEARAVLNTTMLQLAVSDRAEIEEMIAAGTDREAAMAAYLTEEHFKEWYEATLAQLQEIIQ